MNHHHDQNHASPACRCICHRMTGILIFFLGLVFLLGNLEVLSAKIVGIAWPTILALLGLKHLCANACKCCGSAERCEKK